MQPFEVNKLAERPVLWLTDGGDTVAVSSRVRLARNLSDYPFPGRAGGPARREIFDIVCDVSGGLASLKPAFSGEMVEFDDVARSVLLERRIVSRELCACGAGSGFVCRDDETACVMINEEDHLRIQSLLPGLRLAETFAAAAQIEQGIASLLRYAYSPRLGFLTACPSNVGTGLRASVMLHLPGLVLTGQMPAVANGSSRLGVGVRGMLGEGTEATGSLFQVSNQSTLGEREEDIIGRLEHLIGRIISAERDARIRMVRSERNQLYDHIARAHAVLREAYILSSNEALNCLSAVRLGVELGLFSSLTMETVNHLLVTALPGHLQVAQGGGMDARERDIVRADLVRKVLSELDT